GIGAIVAPGLTSAFGLRGALIAAGAALSAIVVIFWSRLRKVDAPAPVPEAELALLHGIPIFAPLPPVTIEQLASHLSHVRVTAGEPVFRQGDHGDHFYVVAEGEVMVAPVGRPAVTLGPGGSFGEVALLRDVPRTATVIASTDVELLALERNVFIAAVTGHAPSAAAADAVVATHLGSAVQPL
ncbi:MAG TPA: cyclic nucleotide-binding domain-containing protein, partial [Gaiellaceae bacterium]|nr:cyclic nucleotide-binding domain-containing protein [Gaiellaceae bacterium]